MDDSLKKSAVLQKKFTYRWKNIAFMKRTSKKRKFGPSEKSDEDEPEWQFLASYVTGKGMNDDLTGLAPSVRQSLAALKSIFLDQQECKIVMAGSVMLWLDLGRPANWFPGDVDVFSLEIEESLDQKKGDSPCAELVRWLEEQKWIKVNEPSISCNSNRSNPPSLCDEFTSERWILPSDEKRSINIVRVKLKPTIFADSVNFDTLNLANRFDIPACGRTWPKTKDPTGKSHDNKICMWPVRDDPFSRARAQKYKDRIGPQLVIQSGKLQTAEFKGVKASVRHTRQPVFTHYLGIGPCTFQFRNRYFADTNSGPYCFRDLYSSSLQPDLFNQRCRWQPELFNKRCTDRKCGSLVWEDEYAWHIHEEKELVVVHCVNRLLDEENHRAVVRNQSTLLYTAFRSFAPEMVVTILEFLDNAQLAKIVWPALVANSLPVYWQRFIHLRWLIDRVKSSISCPSPDPTPEMVLSTLPLHPLLAKPMDTVQSNSTDQPEFWVFAIQQLAFDECVIMHCGPQATCALEIAEKHATIKTIFPHGHKCKQHGIDKSGSIFFDVSKQQ